MYRLLDLDPVSPEKSKRPARATANEADLGKRRACRESLQIGQVENHRQQDMLGASDQHRRPKRHSAWSGVLYIRRMIRARTGVGTPRARTAEGRFHSSGIMTAQNWSLRSQSETWGTRQSGELKGAPLRRYVRSLGAPLGEVLRAQAGEESAMQ